MIYLDRAAMLPGELPVLAAYISNLTHRERRAEYQAWLRAHGDSSRANFLHALSEAFERPALAPFPAMDDIPAAWASMVAAPQIKALCDEAINFDAHELAAFRDRVFARAQPALSILYEEAEEEPPIGSSVLWGRPDLPPGRPWPVRGECLHFHGDCDLPADLPCSFSGQLNLADLAGTVAALALPPEGLLSFFQHTETEKFGVTSSRMIFTRDTSRLERRDLPQAVAEDEDMPPSPAHDILVQEFLSFPFAEASPWSADLPEEGWGKTFSDLYSAISSASPGFDPVGLLGYFWSSSAGEDATPDKDHLRLAAVRATPEAGLIHLLISRTDLAAGDLEKAQYLWNDWDG